MLFERCPTECLLISLQLFFYPPMLDCTSLQYGDVRSKDTWLIPSSCLPLPTSITLGVDSNAFSYSLEANGSVIIHELYKVPSIEAIFLAPHFLLFVGFPGWSHHREIFIHVWRPKFGAGEQGPRAYLVFGLYWKQVRPEGEKRENVRSALPPDDNVRWWWKNLLWL